MSLGLIQKEAGEHESPSPWEDLVCCNFNKLAIDSLALVC